MTLELMIKLHRAIVPDFNTIREILPQLVDFNDDDYPDASAELRQLARSWVESNSTSLETTNLNRLAELCEIIWEMH